MLLPRPGVRGGYWRAFLKSKARMPSGPSSVQSKKRWLTQSKAGPAPS